MKKRLKITEGKAEVVSYSDGEEMVAFVNIENAKSIISITNPFDNKFFDAEIIADAFNTANEADKLPSEIKQERDQLIRVLQDFISSGELIDDEYFSMEIDQAKELINKIKDNE